jgi:hypothetical protein
MDNAIGGGEVLKYIGGAIDTGKSYLDEGVIRLYKLLPYIKILILLLIMVIVVYGIFKLFNLRNPFTARAIKSEISYVKELRRRDRRVLRANNFIKAITNIIEATPLSMDKSYIDYWEYNIHRAGIRIPGGSRYMHAVELHALIQVGIIIGVLFSIFVILFLNSIIGWVLLVSVIIAGNTCPMLFIRSIVAQKDLEIKENFVDLYLMMHYVLISDAGVPLENILRSYSKATTSNEMKRFIDVCIHYIDTYGEYEATNYISREYREVPEVTKLMRLIRQSFEGGEVKAELEGFRRELLNEKRYAIQKRMEKLVKRAQFSFNILMIVLIQAILSAMSIYIKDLSLLKGLLFFN